MLTEKVMLKVNPKNVNMTINEDTFITTSKSSKIIFAPSGLASMSFSHWETMLF
jgi:hypothetical protein